MVGKLLLLAGLVPFVISFAVAQFLGARRLSRTQQTRQSAVEMVQAVLASSGITVKQHRSWWFGSNPLKEKEFSLSAEVAESKDVKTVAAAVQAAGLALLQGVHEKSVLVRYKSVRFAAVFPLFVLIAAVLGRVVGRVNTSMCLGVISISLGLACLACLLTLATEREAANRAAKTLEKEGFFKRMSEQEAFEEALYGVVYLQALPRFFQKFALASIKPKSDQE